MLSGDCPDATCKPKLRFRLHSPIQVPMRSPKPLSPKKVSLSAHLSFVPTKSFHSCFESKVLPLHYLQNQVHLIFQWQLHKHFQATSRQHQPNRRCCKFLSIGELTASRNSLSLFWSNSLPMTLPPGFPHSYIVSMAGTG